MKFLNTYKLAIAITLLLSFAQINSYACDICGCANSGSYFGLMPQSHRPLVGVRYSNFKFNTHPESDILVTKETFNIAEMYVRFFPVKRVQVMAFVPYRFDSQQTSAIEKKNSGLSDITILGNYNVFNTLMDSENTSSSTFTHSLQLGGGIKLPTGKFKYNDNDPLQVANPNFQLGTGSVDFIINGFYTMSLNKWGISSNLSHKINTTNSQGYRFGPQTFGTVDFFRKIEVGQLSIVPSIGLYGEHMDHGTLNGVTQEITGGKILNGSAGLSIFGNKWTIGVNFQKPILQESSSGHVFSKNRVQLQLGWLI